MVLIKSLGIYRLGFTDFCVERTTLHTLAIGKHLGPITGLNLFSHSNLGGLTLSYSVNSEFTAHLAKSNLPSEQSNGKNIIIFITELQQPAAENTE